MWLLTDFAVTKDKKLFIVYVDFSKAYNIVPCAALIQTLPVLGCSAIMLAAIASMYKVSYGVISFSIIQGRVQDF